MISRVSGPEVVGLASTTISLATFTLVIAQFGIPTGTQRFLGRAVGHKDMTSFRNYFKVEFTIVGLTTLIAALMLLLLSNKIEIILGLPKIFLLVASAIVLTKGLISIFQGAFISLLRVKEFAIAWISGAIIRLPIGIYFIMLGFGSLGVALGYFMAFPLTLAILLIIFVKIIGGFSPPRLNELRDRGLDIIKAGMANWPAAVLTRLGPQIGVIIVYGYKGAWDAGIYYIAQAIVMVIFALTASVMSIMFPFLSGMRDGRKSATWRVMRFCLVISIPFTIAALIYSRIVLGFFGKEYIEAELILIILLMSVAPNIIVSGVNSLSYAYGEYKNVVLIGLARSIPRIFLFFILIPLFGGVGAAEAFLTGSVVALIVACFIAHKLALKINWWNITVIFLVPSIIGFFVYSIKLHWFISSILILSISYFTYARLKLIDKSDLIKIGHALLPRRLYKLSIQKLNWAIKMIFGE